MPYKFMYDKNVPYVYDNQLENYIVLEIINKYKYAIDKDKIKYENDFEILWGTIFGSINNDDFSTFEKYTTIFTYLIDILFQKHQENIKSLYVTKDVWSRLEYIYSYDKLQSSSKVRFKDFLYEKIETLKVKYSLENFDYERKHQQIRDIDINKEYDIKVN